jgi:hypothetical protein
MNQFEDLKAAIGERHVEDVKAISETLQEYHAAREREYDRSFAKRGLVGIWHNLGRKFDAIDNLGKKEKLLSVVALDHLVDLALYALKFVATIKKLSPHIWTKWYKEVYMKAVDDKSK